MYIQRIPHPLTRVHRDTNTDANTDNDYVPLLPFAVVDAFQAVPSTSNHQPKPRPTGYIVLAVVLAIALLSLAGLFMARRRSSRFRRKASTQKQQISLQAPAMKREGKGRFDLVPTLNLNLKKTGAGSSSGSDVSPALSSPNSSSEGPLTPSFGDEHELGDIGVNKYSAGSFAPLPIIVHQQGDVAECEITAPDPRLHVHFFDDLPITGYTLAPVASAIRPHGLPLSPVPEESSTAPTLPSTLFNEHPFYGVHYHGQ